MTAKIDPVARNAKLREISGGYRVAVEAYRMAVDLRATDDLCNRLWDIVEREAALAEIKKAELERGSHQNH